MARIQPEKVTGRSASSPTIARDGDYVPHFSRSSILFSPVLLYYYFNKIFEPFSWKISKQARILIFHCLFIADKCYHQRKTR